MHLGEVLQVKLKDLGLFYAIFYLSSRKKKSKRCRFDFFFFSHRVKEHYLYVSIQFKYRL